MTNLNKIIVLKIDGFGLVLTCRSLYSNMETVVVKVGKIWVKSWWGKIYLSGGWEGEGKYDVFAFYIRFVQVVMQLRGDVPSESAMS